MTGFDSKRKMALTKLPDDDDTQVYSDTLTIVYQRGFADGKKAAQPEQEPVGKFAKFTDNIWREVTDGSAGLPLYTTPPQRPWVGLTDEDKKKIATAAGCTEDDDGHIVTEIFRLVEAKLKEKNHD